MIWNRTSSVSFRTVECCNRCTWTRGVYVCVCVCVCVSSVGLQRLYFAIPLSCDLRLFATRNCSDLGPMRFLGSWSVRNSAGANHLENYAPPHLRTPVNPPPFGVIPLTPAVQPIWSPDHPTDNPHSVQFTTEFRTLQGSEVSKRPWRRWMEGLQRNHCNLDEEQAVWCW